MRRLIVTIGMVLGAVFGVVTPASADLTWCKKDPVISLNGAVVDLSVAIPWKYVPLVNGPVRYEIQTPPTTDRKLVVNDLGYNGYGSEVVFKDGSGTVETREIPTTVRVYIPIDKKSLPPGEAVPAELSMITSNVKLIVKQDTSSHLTINTVITGLYN